MLDEFLEMTESELWHKFGEDTIVALTRNPMSHGGTLERDGTLYAIAVQSLQRPCRSNFGVEIIQRIIFTPCHISKLSGELPRVIIKFIYFTYTFEGEK